MRGGRVAVVGGSIAGCAVALAAARGGADEVVVHEREGYGESFGDIVISTEDSDAWEIVARSVGGSTA